MTQLFYNLINNSLKFAKEDVAPLINISCRHLKAEESKWVGVKNCSCYEIVLSDNGIGFEPGQSEQIFGLFKRLNNKQLYSGSGIGLALCRKVVENHKGKVFAEGKENEGTSFHILLPERQS